MQGSYAVHLCVIDTGRLCSVTEHNLPVSMTQRWTACHRTQPTCINDTKMNSMSQNTTYLYQWHKDEQHVTEHNLPVHLYQWHKDEQHVTEHNLPVSMTQRWTACDRTQPTCINDTKMNSISSICASAWQNLPSRKHAYIILTSLNPTFYSKTGVF